MKERKTKGQIKLNSYLQDLLKNQRFLDHIDNLRTYFKNMEYTTEEEKRSDLREKLYTACSTYNIPPYPGRIVVDQLIRGEKLEKLDINLDVCRIKTLSQQDEFPPEIAAEYEISYPVSIGISRYSTIDDIRDYIEKNKDLIREYLEEHQNAENIIKHYKRRNASVAARNDFIFENRDKTRKALVSLVSDKFGQVMGYDDIGKTIQREKKRRQME